MIYNIQFVVERLKPDLYQVLEGTFLIFPDFNIFMASCTWYTNLSLSDPILKEWRHNIGLEFSNFQKIVSSMIAYFWFLFFYYHSYMRYKTWDV